MEFLQDITGQNGPWSVAFATAYLAISALIGIGWAHNAFQWHATGDPKAGRATALLTAVAFFIVI